MPLRSRALPLGGRGPGEHEARSLSDAVAVGAHPAVRQVHQALHDEEAESGAIVGAAAPGMQPREALEEPSALAAAKADPGIAHRELDLTVLRTRAQGDAAPAVARHGGKGVLEDVAHHDIERQRIADHLEARLVVAGDGDALLAGALLEVGGDARHRGAEVERLGLEGGPWALGT